MWFINVEIGKPIIGHRKEYKEGYIEVSDVQMEQFNSLPSHYIWDGTTLVAPPVPPPPHPYIPQSVTMRQARLQLSVLGVYATVNAAVASMGESAEIEWEYGATVDRSNPLTAGIVQLLGWTQQQTDNYFTAASRL